MRKHFGDRGKEKLGSGRGGHGPSPVVAEGRETGQKTLCGREPEIINY